MRLCMLDTNTSDKHFTFIVKDKGNRFLNGYKFWSCVARNIKLATARFEQENEIKDDAEVKVFVDK